MEVKFLLLSTVCISVFYGIAWFDSWWGNRKRSHN